MSFLASSYLADADDFRRRVMLALINAAKDVMAEDSQTASHLARVTYASSVLANPTQSSLVAAQAVVSNVAIDAALSPDLGRYQTSASDSDIQFTVNSLFNALAGVAK